MLEKMKVWCQDKKEKGKELVQNHKCFIGYVAGISATIACAYLGEAIFGAKRNEGEIYWVDPAVSKDVDFGFGIIGIDRFGKETTSTTLWMKEADKDVIFKNIEAAIEKRNSLKS